MPYCSGPSTRANTTAVSRLKPRPNTFIAMFTMLPRIRDDLRLLPLNWDKREEGIYLIKTAIVFLYCNLPALSNTSHCIVCSPRYFVDSLILNELLCI